MTKASMLNAKRIFFIVLSNVGVRLFRRGIYSTSNSQRAPVARGFERAHAQKHPSTNGHASTLIKRERTTDWGAHAARVLVSPRRNNLLFRHEAYEAHGDILNQENRNRG